MYLCDGRLHTLYRVRPHSALGYRAPEEFARGADGNGCGKDARGASLEIPVRFSLSHNRCDGGFPFEAAEAQHQPRSATLCLD